MKQLDNEFIIQKLNRIEKYIFGLKDILNVEELSDYTGFSKSSIYKLVHKSQIPYSKPNGKLLFFDRKKLMIGYYKIVTNPQVIYSTKLWSTL